MVDTFALYKAFAGLALGLTGKRRQCHNKGRNDRRSISIDSLGPFRRLAESKYLIWESFPFVKDYVSLGVRVRGAANILELDMFSFLIGRCDFGGCLLRRSS